MAKEVVRRFYIVGEGLVKDVGLRPSLIVKGLDYRLRVMARNIPKENKVEVVVEEFEEDVREFWKLVKEVNIRVVGEGSYTVTDLEDYIGPRIDWTYTATTLTLEQIVKGIGYLTSMDRKIDSMDRKLGSIDQRLVKLPQRIAKALREVLSQRQG